jgi:proteasome component ECM29
MADAEISLINKVELRLALASTDEKLSSLLAVYLTPLLLKLNSPHHNVRAKVIEVCQHVNMRVRAGWVDFIIY